MRPVVISLGNPLRGDDAVAHSVAEDVKTATKDRVLVMKRTLPEISDIAALQEYRPSIVFIVDACRLALPDRGFLISRVSGEDHEQMHVHNISMDEYIHVLRLLGQVPVVYRVLIQGEDYKNKKGLSGQAMQNADAGSKGIIELLSSKDQRSRQ